LARLVVPATGATVAAATAGAWSTSACSLWAALDSPYKSEAPEAVEAGAPGAGDAAAEDARPDATEAPDAAAGRVVDAGFVPFAIAAYGDTTYVLDENGRVHVAYDAGTQFTDFWGGGDAVVIENRIAASPAGVFWTVGGGVRHCAPDGGECEELLSSDGPKAIAAGGNLVAWIDGVGLKFCQLPLSSCAPVMLSGPKAGAPPSVAVGPGGIVAWPVSNASTGTTMHFESSAGLTAAPLPYEAQVVVASDEVLDEVDWVGVDAIGTLPFDIDAGGTGAVSMFRSIDKPTEISAKNGVAYFGTNYMPGTVWYCRPESDGGCQVPRSIGSGLGPLVANNGIAVTSRKLMAVYRSTELAGPPPKLVVWSLPR
jgi:hypothetical protein